MDSFKYAFLLLIALMPFGVVIGLIGYAVRAKFAKNEEHGDKISMITMLVLCSAVVAFFAIRAAC